MKKERNERNYFSCTKGLSSFQKKEFVFYAVLKICFFQTPIKRSNENSTYRAERDRFTSPGLVYFRLNFDYSFCWIDISLSDRRLHSRDAFEKPTRHLVITITRSEAADDVDASALLSPAAFGNDRNRRVAAAVLTRGFAIPGAAAAAPAVRVVGERRAGFDGVSSIATYALTDSCRRSPDGRTCLSRLNTCSPPIRTTVCDSTRDAARW